jgi:hypothetical protein
MPHRYPATPLDRPVLLKDALHRPWGRTELIRQEVDHQPGKNSFILVRQDGFSRTKARKLRWMLRHPQKSKTVPRFHPITGVPTTVPNPV